jgi:hypothetical protein
MNDAVDPVATVQRTLLSDNGRKPTGVEEQGCLPPRAPEPLAFLLPAQRRQHTFALATPRNDSRPRTMTLEYTPLVAGSPSLTWRGVCGSLELPGMIRGRVILDAATFAVQRVEQRLTQPVRVPVPAGDRRDGWGDSILVERLDVEMTYEKVQFRKPDEALSLPVEIRRVTLVRTPETKALRVTQRFSNHRRFLTDVRVVPLP